MLNRILISTLAIVSIFALVGCGSSTPEHVEKPMTAPAPPTTDFSSLKTPEEKIKFIEESKAPEVEKKKAIEQIRAGKL